jgi:hypothetical protein
MVARLLPRTMAELAPHTLREADCLAADYGAGQALAVAHARLDLAVAARSLSGVSGWAAVCLALTRSERQPPDRSVA